MKLIFVFVILFFDIFSLSDFSTKAKIYYENNIYKLKKKNNLNNLNTIYLDTLKINQVKNHLKKEIVQLEEKLSNSQNQSEISNSSINELDIESDAQYFVGDVFFGEGNVTLFFKNFQLSGDKVTYDKIKKEFTLEGNVEFVKGDQYFEASRLLYNFESGEGSIYDVYGILDFKSFNEDLEINNEFSENKIYLKKDKEVGDINLINTSRIGLVNNFEPSKNFNITQVKLDIPSITKWRFKTDKFFINNEILSSKNISFTNDVFNKPQFLLNSRNFRVRMVDSKLKIVSGRSTIILDDKLKLPIGRQSISDREPFSKWVFGSDYSEKDGIYLGRSFEDILINKNVKLKLQPYVLIQRAIKGNTNAFRAEDSSIFSQKVKNNITSLDSLALDANLYSNFNLWDLELKTKLNSLNFDRLHDSFRSKLIISRSFDLTKTTSKKPLFSNLSKDDEEYNYLDLEIYSIFREKVYKGYAGDEEIYFGNGINISNNKNFSKNDVIKNISLTYDFGKFKAKANSLDKFEDLSRNVFAFSYNYKFPLWQKKNLDKEIDKSYIYTPSVIKQGISWNTNLNAGLFLYSNDTSQKAISLTTGPGFTFGSFTNKFFDYTDFNVSSIWTSKNGRSPFAFDDIDKTLRLKFDLSQQIIGPLIFSFESFMNLDNQNADYGKLSNNKYSLDFKRRAYSIGAFYDTSSESLGIQFNISNFNYDGIVPRF